MVTKRFALHQTIYLNCDTFAEVENIGEYIRNLITSDTENKALFNALQDVEEYHIEELEEGDE